MIELKIEYLPINMLKPDPENARKHTKKDLNTIQESIESFDFNDPIGIWGEECLIVEGEGRWMALKAKGEQKAPCIRLDHLTDKQRRAYALAHNRTAEMSEWDEEKMTMRLRELAGDFDMSKFGFDDALEEMAEAVDVVEDEPPEPPEKPRAKLGDVYRLGEHRVMCGDSTDAEAVRALMDGEVADLMVTDPPYNCDVGSCERPNSSHNGEHIMNDKMSEETFIAFLSQALRNAEKFLRGGCGVVYLVCGAASYRV